MSTRRTSSPAATSAGLRISDDLDPLPLDAVTTTFAILAKKGAGKTYTASVAAEEIIGAGVRCVILDPTGAWWGLRASSSGSEHGGLPVVILGGEHGDLPLEEHAGERIADLVVDGTFSCVLDLSLLETKASWHRFTLAFARRLYHRNREPLVLMLDEADTFAPQVSRGDDLPLLGAIENIARRGRIRGIGLWLITQRAAVLNKNVLTQIDTLIVMRTTAPHDRKAIGEWIEEQVEEDDEETSSDDVLASLKKLETGEAWIWSPQLLKVLRRIRIRRRRTFDSSATPKVGEKRIEPRALAPVEIDSLRQVLADVGDEPAVEGRGAKIGAAIKRKLEARIAELERELAGARAELERDRDRLADVHSHLRAALEQLAAIGNLCSPLLASAPVMSTPAPGRSRRPPATEPSRVAGERVDLDAPSLTNQSPIASRVMAERARSAPPAPGTLKPAAIRMLEALAAFHPGVMSQAQIAAAAQMTRSGGAFQAHWRALLHAGAIAEAGRDQWSITRRGLELVGTKIEPLPTSIPARVDFWCARLPEQAAAMLRAIAGYTAGLSREELAARVGMTASGGAFQGYLRTLLQNELVRTAGSRFVMTDLTFRSAARAAGAS